MTPRQVLWGTLSNAGSVLKDTNGNYFDTRGWSVKRQHTVTKGTGTAQESTIDATAFDPATDSEVVVHIIDTSKGSIGYDVATFTVSGKTPAELAANAVANSEVSAFVTVSESSETLTFTAVNKNTTFKLAGYYVNENGVEVKLTPTYGTPAVFTTGQPADILALIESAEPFDGVTNKVHLRNKYYRTPATPTAADIIVLELERISDPQLISRVARVDSKILYIADPGTLATTQATIEAAFDAAIIADGGQASGSNEVTTSASGIFTITHGLAVTPTKVVGYLDATSDATYYISQIEVNDTKITGTVLARSNDAVANAQTVTVSWVVY